jgi:hypothetical protein
MVWPNDVSPPLLLPSFHMSTSGNPTPFLFLSSSVGGATVGWSHGKSALAQPLAGDPAELGDGEPLQCLVAWALELSCLAVDSLQPSSVCTHASSCAQHQGHGLYDVLLAIPKVASRRHSSQCFAPSSMPTDSIGISSFLVVCMHLGI